MSRLLCVVSGGDAPGIHAALYHMAALASRDQVALVGANGGFPAVLGERFVPLEAQRLLPLLAMSGTLLASSRHPVLAVPESQETLREVLARHEIDSIILFGGDGTLRHIPPLLERWGVACIGIPTTIDNDVPGTELTLGFDSACNFAYHAIDGIRATGGALPGRIFTLETLGGSTGFLALEVARGAAADAVLVPEYDHDPSALILRLEAAIARSGQALLVYSEGVEGKETLMDEIAEGTGIRVRSTRLGHAQRGGTPSHRDRALAADMARIAYAALASGVKSGVTVVRGGQVALHEGVLPYSGPKMPDDALYRQLNGLA
jgi:6-phosphofructokinase 1